MEKHFRCDELWCALAASLVPLLGLAGVALAKGPVVADFQQSAAYNCSNAVLSAVDPRSVVCEALRQSNDPRLKPDQRERNVQRHFTASLLALIERTPRTRWADFDADVLTGSQEPEELVVDSMISETIGRTRSLVSVTFRGRQAQGVHLVRRYVLATEGNLSRIDDVIYVDEKTESLREFLILGARNGSHSR